MDYYSGSPSPEDYDYNNGNNNNFSSNNNNFSNLIKKNTNLILIALAVLIVFLIVIMFFFGGKTVDYNTKDTDSTLDNLVVYGGTLSPSFSPDVVRYNVVADSNSVSFECTVSSKKATVEGCDEVIEVTDKKVSYNIKVTAEDGNITRYYLTITKF